MKMVLHPNFLKLSPFIERIPERFEQEGETIHKLRNEIKVMVHDGVFLNVKCYRKPHFINRLAYSYFRKSKAQRAYEHGLSLLEKGIGTPMPIAYVEIMDKRLIEKSYFVTLHIQNARDFREFSDQSDVTDRKDILVAFGQFAAKMHQLDVQPLDLSAGNILFRKENEAVIFWLVDLNRMRFGRVGFNRACRNFERLRGNTEYFKLLIQSYANERGFDAGEFLKKVLVLKKKSERHFQKKQQRKKRHAK